MLTVFALTALFQDAAANAPFWARGLMDSLWGSEPASDYVKSSLDYAVEQVDQNLAAIKANIKTNFASGPPTIDLLWPGNGYDQAGYAGQYAVLKYLESKNVLKVGRIMGSSGGATAGLLALASEETGVKAAQKMLESFGIQGDMTLADNLDMENKKLRKEYLARITNAKGKLTGTVERDLYCAVYYQPDDPLLGESEAEQGEVVLYNIQTPELAAEATIASGGTHFITKLPGTLKCIAPDLENKHQGVRDGGLMTAFNGELNPTIYYLAWEGNVLSCDRGCINTVSNVAVDNTISLLTSPNLVVSPSSWTCMGGAGSCSGGVLSKTGTGKDLEALSKEHLSVFMATFGHPARNEPLASPEILTWVDASTAKTSGHLGLLPTCDKNNEAAKERSVYLSLANRLLRALSEMP